MARLGWIAATLLVVPGPVLAQIVFVEPPPKKVATAKTDSPKSDLDKVECRRQDVPGTRVYRRMVCLTAQQWRQLHHDDREWIEHIQAMSGIGPAG